MALEAQCPVADARTARNDFAVEARRTTAHSGGEMFQELMVVVKAAGGTAWHRARSVRSTHATELIGFAHSIKFVGACGAPTYCCDATGPRGPGLIWVKTGSR